MTETPRMKGRLVSPPPIASSVTVRPKRQPTANVGGRPFSKSTPLGKILALRGISVTELSNMAMSKYGPGNGLNIVRLSHYLNRKKPMTVAHRGKIAALLQVKPEWLDDQT